jgi:hypothetical protein
MALTDTLIAQANAELSRMADMHEAIKKLLANFTPEELAIWNDLERQAELHHRQSGDALDDIYTIRDSDPETYINRLHASIERSTDETKRLTNAMKALVDKYFERRKTKNN